MADRKPKQVIIYCNKCGKELKSNYITLTSRNNREMHFCNGKCVQRYESRNK